ncbi:SMI1/KNR4 family protein [Chryseobacterium chendengshani]|uniref:SMI1/KNR4 family protein n=1 Tax=unclassified Chryseobacterium TaxID=2593645 RepID=UPI001C63FDB0|nr:MULTISPECIES: SMI1/KNR4 family protein [unclassified Chryseobacterium]MBW7676921.1 SMI1/KNR4 family protein [Chryseobacterium sp. LJ756]MBW8524570.1 SMI1/KNR4 family protein [Chryseobacterium sp. LJ668]QYK17293.1 SMI1/KNR4 family protein [Chryseobacterium sp. LJ668]
MEFKFFKDFDLTNFWSECSYSSRDYIEDALDQEMIESIEKQLGYKLPDSYIELMKTQNGGLVNKSCFPTDESNSWAEDHIAITGFLGIGRTKTNSLCGALGSQFMIDEWGYPAIGVYIADCPSAGHDMILLDYSKCGKDGEPEVVHVDQENDYKKIFLAKDFETFIRGLEQEEKYDSE